MLKHKFQHRHVPDNVMYHHSLRVTLPTQPNVRLDPSLTCAKQSLQKPNSGGMILYYHLCSGLGEISHSLPVLAWGVPMTECPLVDSADLCPELGIGQSEKDVIGSGY